MRVTAICHTGIVVSKMQISLPFYRGLLGLRVCWDQIEKGPFVEAVSGIPGACIHTIKLKAPNGVLIELLEYLNSPRPFPPLTNADDVGCGHAALQVSGLDGLYENAVAAGIRFTTSPVLAAGGKARATYCRDPEGAYVELVGIL